MNTPDESNNQQTNALISVPPPASQSLVTTNHPTDIGSYYGGRAYPYRPQQGRTEGGAAWVFNIGNNINIKGKQRVGSIIVGNTCNGASLPTIFPQNGRFIFNAGGNTNEGDLQEVGSIEFGNARGY